MNTLLNLLKLPVLKDGVTIMTLGKHYLTIIFCTGIAYFLIAMGAGVLQGDVWMYVQSSQEQYLEQALILAGALILGYIFRILLKLTGDFIFNFWKTDKYFYPIATIVTYLVINEIWGM